MDVRVSAHLTEDTLQDFMNFLMKTVESKFNLVVFQFTFSVGVTVSGKTELQLIY